MPIIVCRSRLSATLITLMLLGAVSAGCTAAAEKDVVGTWRTRLTGYNTVAAGITQYDQTVKFTPDGLVEMYNTLPGDLNLVKGRYELTKLDGHPIIKITWDAPVDKPSELYYKFQGENLLTSRAPGSLDASKQLNVGNQDPVVYERFDGTLPQ
jgi:hypothetical protein